MIKYWPDKGCSANFGPLKVKCVEQDESVADLVVRTFQLSDTKNKVNNNIILSLNSPITEQPNT